MNREPFEAKFNFFTSFIKINRMNFRKKLMILMLFWCHEYTDSDYDSIFHRRGLFLIIPTFQENIFRWFSTHFFCVFHDLSIKISTLSLKMESNVVQSILIIHLCLHSSWQKIGSSRDMKPARNKTRIVV